MRKGGMILGAIVGLIGLPVYFYANIILATQSWEHWGPGLGFYIRLQTVGFNTLILGIIVLVVSAIIPKHLVIRKPPTIRITCPKCGQLNEENAKFCNSCGAPLTPPKPKTIVELERT